jgi:photosystem II stability/assembly factor-like uncharacterized protein
MSVRSNSNLGSSLLKLLPAWAGGLLLVGSLAALAQQAVWEPRGIGGGGALFFPSLSPHAAGECFITCDMAEYFHSTDGGESWAIPENHGLISTSRGRVQFTNDPDVLYALDASGDSPAPAKSADGGGTWTRLTSDPTGGDAYSLFADPGNQNRLLIASYTELFFSGDGGAAFYSRYSNADGLHISGAFFDNDTIYVGTSSGLLRSINGGQSFALMNWSGLPANDAMISFAGARAGGTVRLYCLTGDVADVYPGITGGDYGSYRAIYSLDVGTNFWNLKSSGIGAGDYPFFLSMAANDVNVVYAAGATSNFYAPLVLKSANGGTSWTNVFDAQNNQNISTGWCGDHGDVNWGWAETALGFACASNESNRAIITDYGFAHLTTDGGATWKQIYSASGDQNPPGAWTPKWRFYHGIGLEPTACWNLAWSDSTHLFAGYSDIVGTRSTDSGMSWAHTKIDSTRSFGVNCVYYTLKHPATGTLYAAASSIHDLYQSTYLTDARIDGGTGQIWFSADNGATWALLHNFAHPVIWIAPDPTNSNRLYVSVVHSTQGGIFVTNDLQNGSGSAWARVAIPPRTEGHPLDVVVLNDGTLVSTYSGRRANNAFTQSSGVFVSTNGGASWLDRSSPQMLYWTKDLAVDPHDILQTTWFVAVHRGWGGAPNDLGGLFKTTNRGQSWTQISDLLYAESCAINPLDSSECYLTTETDGLWICSNLRNAEPVFTPVEAYPFVRPNRVYYDPYHPDQVWVTSFGNGIRVGSPVAAPDAVHDLTIYPSGASMTLRWSAVPGAQSYLVYGSASPGFETETLLGVTASTMFVHAPVASVYFYRLIASSASP